MKVRNLTLIVSVAVVILALLAATPVAAAKKMVSLESHVHSVEFSKAVPGLLNYQGYLADASDSSAVTGNLEMTFRLFDTETKGVEVWVETRIVEVSSGLFEALLGSITPFPPGLFDGTQYWLQTEVGMEVLTPRKPLVSVAYSHRANSAEKLLDFTLPQLDDRWVDEEDLDHLDAADGDPANAVYVDLVGEVGIGTTAPARNVHIYDNSDGIVGIEIENPNTGSSSIEMITFTDENGGVAGVATYDDGSLYPSAMRIYNNRPNGTLGLVVGTERVRINNDGKVGIGTATPAKDLDVNGEVIATTYWGDGSNLTGIAGTADADWTIMGNDIYSGVSGNVGIGTAAPTEKLHVVGSSGNYAVISGPTYGVYGRHTANNKYGYLGGSYGAYGEDFGTGNNGYLGGDNYGVYGSSVAGHAGYFVGNGYFSGDVGIGITSPSQEFHVEGVFPQIHMHQPGMGPKYFTVGAGVGGFSIDDHLLNEPFFFPYGTPTYTLNADTSGGITLGHWGPARAGLEIYRDIGDFELRLTEQGTTSSDHAQILCDSDSADYALGVNSSNGVFYLWWYDYADIFDASGPEGWITLNYDTYIYGETNTYGDLTVHGDFLVSGGTKSFVQEDPSDPGKAIVYACLEGPESGTYLRGSTQLVDGRAMIELPDHFAKVTAQEGLTVHLTPTGQWLQLYVVEKSPDRIAVAETDGRDGTFDYLIQGVRKGYEDFQVVRDRDDIPGLDRQEREGAVQGGSPGTASQVPAVRPVRRTTGNKTSAPVSRDTE